MTRYRFPLTPGGAFHVTPGGARGIIFPDPFPARVWRIRPGDRVVWARALEAFTSSVRGSSVAIDGNGFALVGLWFNSSGTMGVLQRLHPNGNASWSYEITTGNFIGAQAVALDSNDDAYIGQFISSPGGDDHTVRKITSAGSLAWSHRKVPEIGGVAVRSDDRIFATGLSHFVEDDVREVIWAYNTSGLEVDTHDVTRVDNMRGVGIATSASSSRVAVVGSVLSGNTSGIDFRVLGSSLSTLWTKALGHAQGVAFDQDDNVYVCGALGMGGGVRKYDSSGNHQWTISAASPVRVRVGPDGYVWFASASTGTFTRGIHKLDPDDGSTLWRFDTGGPARDVAFYDNGDIAVTGNLSHGWSWDAS